MHHPASRLHAVVAALLLALGALSISVVVASQPTAPESSAVGGASARRHVGVRHETIAPRVTSKAIARGGPHVDVIAAFAAGIGTLLVLGWLVAARRRAPLPRLAAAAFTARAPPAPV
jgi:hypothetical protein